MKCGRITKWRSESNMVKPKFGLKSFHPSSSYFLWLLPYLRDRGKIMFCCSQILPSMFHQSSPNLEEYIMAIQGVT